MKSCCLDYSVGEVGSNDVILVRSPNWLGDAVFCAAAVSVIRRAFPKARIVVLCNAKLEGIWRLRQDIEGIIPRSPNESPLETARKIKRYSPSLVFIFPHSLRTALEAWLAGVPVRIGYAGRCRGVFLTHLIHWPGAAVKFKKRSRSEIKRLLVLDKTQPEPEIEQVRTLPLEHHLRVYLRLVGHDVNGWLPGCNFSVSEIAKHSIWARLGLAEDRYIGLIPGGEYGEAKRWPAEYFIDLVRLVSDKLPCRWIIFGKETESKIAKDLIYHGLPVIDLCGKTSLEELAAALLKCQMVVSNDTGPMHLAAALGVPVLGLFGSTSPSFTGPIPFQGVQHTVIRAAVKCAPCFRRRCPADFRCMRSIKPDLVTEALVKQLSV